MIALITMGLNEMRKENKKMRKRLKRLAKRQDKTEGQVTEMREKHSKTMSWVLRMISQQHETNMARSLAAQSLSVDGFPTPSAHRGIDVMAHLRQCMPFLNDYEITDATELVVDDLRYGSSQGLESLTHIRFQQGVLCIQNGSLLAWGSSSHLLIYITRILALAWL